MEQNSPRFGPAGNSESFYAMGNKNTVQIPEYLCNFGLSAFEYQCGHGLKVNVSSLQVLKNACSKKDIALSLHTPYYISLSSLEEEKRDKSIGYLLESAKILRELGGTRMVVHSGSCGKQSRESALTLALDTLRRARQALIEAGFADMHLCLETMGKINQLGTLDEVMTLCESDDSFLPCIDFGHLNARTFGKIKSKSDYAEVLDKIENRLGRERLKHFHAHFSKIEYAEPGGEKKHLTFADTMYGPNFEPLAELLAERGLSPTIICESAGTQAEDAAQMKQIYQKQKRMVKF